MMMPSGLFLAPASWIESTISPSWLDCRNSTFELVALGRLAQSAIDVLQRGAAIGLRLARAEQMRLGPLRT